MAARPGLIVSRVRRALSRGELALHLQPQVDLATGQVLAVEALVRWRSLDRGLILPGAFIDAVQRSGFARTFDSWVLEAAVGEAVALRQAGHPLRVAVNIGPASVQAPGLVGQVAELLRHRGVPPELLEVEVTEQVLDAERQAAATVAGLAALGVHTALDDFGVGFSSLTRIAAVPFSLLKVDRSLLVGSAENARAATVFAAAIKLAHDLGLSVVAEGVETAEAWRQSARLGADRAQGWLIAGALPRPELIALLDREVLRGPGRAWPSREGAAA